MFQLFRKRNETRDLRLPPELSKKDREKVEEIIRQARKDDGIPRTAQQSIPFDRMFPDGICRVSGNYYTKTIRFQDINYQLAQQEDKTAIFEEWCGFLNFFDSSVRFELSFMNMSTDAENFEKSIRIPSRKDGFDDVRSEYSDMLKMQLSQGNNGLTKTKYLTFGIEAESVKQAKPRLAHVQNDILNNFRQLGVQAEILNGEERLKLMHDMFHMGDVHDRFRFDWKWLPGSGLSVKDFIAPTAFAFPGSRTFRTGSLYGAMSYLAITAPDLSDQLLKDFLDMDSSQIVTMHIQSVDQTEAIKTIKHTITELDRSKIEEQKKAVRAGYDMDIIPSDLATYGKDAKDLLKELQSQNERMFLVTVLVMNTGKTEGSTRKVFLPKTVANMLIEWKKEQDFVKEALGNEYQDYNLVMAGPVGFPIEASTMQTMFNRLIEKQGLPRVVFHSLRHSSITYKLKLNGGDVKAVQGDSGHSQTSMVTDVYSHILDDDRRMNAQLFEDAFYNRKEADPSAPAKPLAPEEQKASVMDTLMRLLSNPETAGLLKQLVKAMDK